MTKYTQLDLSLCAKEPIHTPDAIQPFAYMLIIEDKLLPDLIPIYKFIQEHHVSQSYYEHLMKRLRQVLNIDRVMLYKFHDDGHGEVLAESKGDRVGSYLNHHFPEHDIPKQARQLYISNKLRLIEDRTNQNVPLIYDSQLDKIDLSKIDVRAVSPVHIKYLENMGIVCSLSISIVEDNKLWGLITCHSFKKHYFSQETRLLLTLLSNQLSNQIKLSQIAEEKLWTQQSRVKLLPRVSFDTWLEEVHEQSKPWAKKDIFLATQIRLLLATRF